MCVRYRQSSTEEEVAEFFEAELREELHPRYNIAPSQQAPAIRQAECGRVIANVQWGLVPFWARATSIGYKLINGCSEMVLEEPAFRGSLINSPRNDTPACAERAVPANPLFPRRPKTSRGNGGQLCFPGTASLNQKFYHDGP
jgi:putative SOS response-associated peptidase YedK